MAPPPRLSNCYAPVVHNATASSSPESSSSRKEEILTRRKESGRSPHELRRLHIQSDFIPSAAGSCLVELGQTKVLCRVTGPVPSTSAAVPSHLQLSMDDGTLWVDVRYAPGTGSSLEQLGADAVESLDTNNNSNISSTNRNTRSALLQRETDLSHRVLSAIQASIPLHVFPKCCLCLHLTVLHDDGSCLSACVTAATTALSTVPGLQLYDVVTSCTVAALVVTPADTTGRSGSSTTNTSAPSVHLLADPTLEEQQAADSTVTICMLPAWKEVTVWEQTGSLTTTTTTATDGSVDNDSSRMRNMTNDTVNLCRDGCRTMQKFLREHLLSVAPGAPPSADPEKAS